VLAVRGPVLVEPLADSLPDHPPEALQVVALVAFQVRVELPPLTMLLGFALKATVGAGDVTATVADCDPLPPGPVQLKPNVALAVSTPVDCEPWTALLPDHAPVAVQAVALTVLHVRVALEPLVTVLGDACSVTVGNADLIATVADWAALPPGPVQVRV
jgi:hypothetical protein